MAPLDLLRRWRGIFVEGIPKYREAAAKAPPGIGRDIANAIADQHEKLVEQIDTTLREWG